MPFARPVGSVVRCRNLVAYSVSGKVTPPLVCDKTGAYRSSPRRVHGMARFTAADDPPGRPFSGPRCGVASLVDWPQRAGYRYQGRVIQHRVYPLNSILI